MYHTLTQMYDFDACLPIHQHFLSARFDFCWQYAIERVSFAGKNFCKFRISLAICKSFIHENQPGIGSRHRDMLERPT